MAVKKMEIPPIGQVAFYKRRKQRAIRVSFNVSGEIRVTMPVWTPYKVAINFVRQQQAWIMEHRPKPRALLIDGARVGPAHILRLRPTTGKIRTRLTADEAQVYYPSGQAWQDEAVQRAAEKVAVRALKQVAEDVLPPRVQALAIEHGFSYHSVGVKRLKARWGSCDSQKRITLNLFLVQLPDELIDYVLLHELTHTKVMRHGPPFWEAMDEHVPRLSELRKAVRAHQPTLQRVNNDQNPIPNQSVTAW